MTTLILGGTTEAARLANAMADAGLLAILSYAGRTAAPRPQALRTRIGGFGGADGLAAWLRANQIARVVDATHPFAAQISANAVAACAATGTPLLALERPAWAPGPGDDWRRAADLASAAEMLDGPPQRVFLAIGRQHLDAFAGQPQHHYLLRLVDPPTDPLPLSDCTVIIARGPFDAASDRALLQEHRIGLIVAKNAGGGGAVAKLTAARDLALPVVMIDRPAMPARQVVHDIGPVLHWCHTPLGV